MGHTLAQGVKVRLSTRSEGAAVRALGEKHMIQEVLQCRNVARRVQ